MSECYVINLVKLIDAVQRPGEILVPCYSKYDLDRQSWYFLRACLECKLVDQRPDTGTQNLHFGEIPKLDKNRRD